MKSNTRVHVAIRNIGDSTDNGDLFEGSLKDSIMWIVQKIGTMNMKQRIVIGIGRDQPGAVIAIQDKRQSRATTSVDNDQLRSLLDSVLAEGSDDAPEGTDDPFSSTGEIQVQIESSHDPLDNWQGVKA